MNNLIGREQKRSRYDNLIRVFDDCIIYQGLKVNYQLSENEPDLEVRIANIVVDGVSHRFDLESRTFNLDFINLLGIIPEQELNKMRN